MAKKTHNINLENEEDKNVKHYVKLRKMVIAHLGDALQNLSERRREKIITRSVALYVKANNEAVLEVSSFLSTEVQERDLRDQLRKESSESFQDLSSSDADDT